MGKRGPKPKAKDAKKSANLGARITIGTRRGLEAAALANGRSLSQEVETRLARSLHQAPEDELLELLRMGIEATDKFTGQSWLADPFTFNLMAAVTEGLLRAFRPEGEPRMPETCHGMFSFDPSIDRVPQLRQLKEQMRAQAERQPPEAWARSIYGGLIIALQRRGVGRNDQERAIFERLAKLRDLLTEPALGTLATPEGESSK